jgi:hypothetical protein
VKIILDVIVCHVRHGLLVFLCIGQPRCMVENLSFASCSCETCHGGFECEFLPRFDFGDLEQGFDGCDSSLKKCG